MSDQNSKVSRQPHPQAGPQVCFWTLPLHSPPLPSDPSPALSHCSRHSCPASGSAPWRSQSPGPGAGLKVWESRVSECSESRPGSPRQKSLSSPSQFVPEVHLSPAHCLQMTTPRLTAAQSGREAPQSAQCRFARFDQTFSATS